MKKSEAFKSNYLGQGDLDQPEVGTIETVENRDVRGDNGKMEEKAVMVFSNGIKPLILNNINWDVCETLYGLDSDAWAGKKIEVYADPNVMFGKQRTGGVRLRAPSNGAAKPNQVDQALAGNGPAKPKSFMSQAWMNFRAATTHMNDDERKKAWKEFLADQFPGMNPQSVADEDWAETAKAAEVYTDIPI